MRRLLEVIRDAFTTTTLSRHEAYMALARQSPCATLAQSNTLLQSKETHAKADLPRDVHPLR